MEQIRIIKGRTGRNIYIIPLALVEEFNLKSREAIELFLWGKDLKEMFYNPDSYKDGKSEDDI